MNYVLRLQALDGYSAKFDAVFGDRFSRVLCVHHMGKTKDNPHWHFCLTTDYQKQALRAHLKKHFTLATGNKHLSLKDWDANIKACSYLFHEDRERQPHICKGFTTEEIDEFMKQNDLIQSKMIKPHHVVDVVVDYFKQKYPNGKMDYDKREIFIKIMSTYKHNGEWLPDARQASRLVNKVRSDLAETQPQEDWLMRMLFNEYFPYG